MKVSNVIAVLLPLAQVFGQGPAKSPVPATESWLTGWIDLGYRWRTDVGGSFNTYRSFVNLGSGPKLFGTEFTVNDPKHRWFDRIRARAYSWGGEPYETFHVDAEKSKLYRFSADYRDVAYFDFLSSYADPLLSRGIILNEQSFDTRRKFSTFELDFLPGNWLIPYFAYDRDAGSGTGVTAFITDSNQFPVPNSLHNMTSLYRGGVRFELRRLHATLEQGGTTFEDNQKLFQSPGSANFGNVLTPVLGQSTYLTGLLATYGIHGTSIYTKALLAANPRPWLDLYGQFLYSQPDTDTHYQQAATGNLLILNPLLFYTSLAYLVSSAAKLPHTAATLGAEQRFGRLRFTETWLTDRLHNAGSSTSNQVSTNSGTSAQIAALLNSSLVSNYNHVEADVFYDMTSKLMLRGGYRYVWGNVSDAILPPAGLASSDQARLRRNAGLGAVTFRPAQKLSLMAEVEAASSGAVYFRTSLDDDQKIRAQARYQAIRSLSITGDFAELLNHNPTQSINFHNRAQQGSVSLLWSPTTLWNLQGSYTRSTVYSNIRYLDPGTLQPQVSLYRDNAHTATGLLTVNLAHGSAIRPKITAGGSFFISSGSRPTRYYQPLVTLWLPVQKHVQWFGEWCYHGYGEVFYAYENFHTNLAITGLRLIR